MWKEKNKNASHTLFHIPHPQIREVLFSTAFFFLPTCVWVYVWACVWACVRVSEFVCLVLRRWLISSSDRYWNRFGKTTKTRSKFSSRFTTNDAFAVFALAGKAFPPNDTTIYKMADSTDVTDRVIPSQILKRPSDWMQGEERMDGGCKSWGEWGCLMLGKCCDGVTGVGLVFCLKGAGLNPWLSGDFIFIRVYTFYVDPDLNIGQKGFYLPGWRGGNLSRRVPVCLCQTVASLGVMLGGWGWCSG